MRHWTKALCVLAMSSSGCGTLVLDPLESDPQGAGGSPPQVMPSNVPNAVAMRFSQWNLLPHYGSPFELSFPNGNPDPDALVLFFSDRPQPCAQPVVQIAPSADPATCASQVFWQTIVALPPGLAQPGVINLNNTDIDVYQASWRSDCSGGSGIGPGLDGSLEIVSLDASAVSVKLQADAIGGTPSLDGDYTATLCP
ncbi:MAG: hypothetical protein QM820_49190 [Minicystis sp.]